MQARVSKAADINQRDIEQQQAMHVRRPAKFRANALRAHSATQFQIGLPDTVRAVGKP